jgi:hypothetical protein
VALRKVSYLPRRSFISFSGAGRLLRSFRGHRAEIAHQAGHDALLAERFDAHGFSEACPLRAIRAISAASSAARSRLRRRPSEFSYASLRAGAKEKRPLPEKEFYASAERAWPMSALGIPGSSIARSAITYDRSITWP